MSLIEDLKALDTNASALIAIFFASFIAPAFLLIYRLNPELFTSIDTFKLIILSISIATPSFVVLFIVTWVADVVLTHTEYQKEGHLGTMADWFVTHGISNTVILYFVTFLAYAFSFSLKAVVWWMATLVFFNVAHEIWRVTIVAKGPNFKHSALKWRR